MNTTQEPSNPNEIRRLQLEIQGLRAKVFEQSLLIESMKKPSPWKNSMMPERFGEVLTKIPESFL